MSSLDQRFDAIDKEIEHLRSRNQRVDSNKAWEQSFVRKGTVAIITYIVTLLVFTSIGASEPYLNAFIPTVGYLLSTLSLSFVRSFWEARQ